MKYQYRLMAGVIAAGALMMGSSASALAGGGNEGEFGQMVAMCAQHHLGPRANPPSVTCTCPATCTCGGTTCACAGKTMTFENFGKMVQHMREMNCR